jgi:hypothetical protein
MIIQMTVTGSGQEDINGEKFYYFGSDVEGKAILDLCERLHDLQHEIDDLEREAREDETGL